MENKSLNFIKSNKFLILGYLIVICITIPVETIGFSHYISDITTSVKGRDFNYAIIYKSIIFIIIIFIGVRLLSAFRYYLEIIISSKLTYKIRTSIFNETLMKCYNEYDQIEKGKIISYLSAMPHLYEDKIHFILAEIGPKVIGILALNVFFFWVDTRLGLIMLIFFIVLYITTLFVSRKCVDLKKIKQDTYYNRNEKVQDKLSNVFSIMTSSNLKNEIQDNDNGEKKYQDKKFKSDIEDLKAENIMMLVMAFFVTLALLYFIKLFSVSKNKKIIITAFLVFFSYIGYLDGLKWFTLDLFNKNALIKQYYDSLKLKNENNIHNGSKKDFITQGEIKFKNMYFSYNQKSVFKNFTENLEPNSLNIIMGPSGSGKSTIFKILLKMIQPASGYVLIDNENIYDANIDYLRSNISIVNQNTILFNDTVFKNIAYNNDKVSKNKVLMTMKKLGLDQTIFKNIKLDQNVGVDGYYLSSGQRQMILILREYLNDKKIILMDEPTASLDPETKVFIIQILLAISKNKTIIVTTHDNIFKGYANKIINITK